MEGPETGPQAIKVWFYPGISTGHEFIYPRSQAMRLAQRTGDSVLTTKTETQIAPAVAESEITRVDRSGADAAVSGQTAPETARSQSGTVEATPSAAEVAATTSPENAARPQDSPAPTRTARTDLPGTASLLPLLALLGLGSIVGSRLLRQ